MRASKSACQAARTASGSTASSAATISLNCRVHELGHGRTSVPKRSKTTALAGGDTTA